MAVDSSLQLRDFLTVFGLDRANIKKINIYHEKDGLIIDLELNVHEHSCPARSTIELADLFALFAARLSTNMILSLLADPSFLLRPYIMSFRS